MPKLNTTVDNLEWKSNRVTASVPSSTWTDAQYPSAKALYNAYAKLLNSQHPIGSVVITATNSNPSSTFGGTWTLIDKGFISSNTTSTDYFVADQNVTENAVWVTRAGQTMRIRLNFTLNTDVVDTTGLTIGTFDYNAMGITRIPANFVSSVTYSDGANGGIAWSLNEVTGALVLTDVFDLATIPSGSSFGIDISFPLVYNQMLDSVCDKFYWKRIA